MPKNIVFCADGTWNGPGEGESAEELSGTTNVLKLFLNLEGTRAAGTVRLADEEESSFVGSGGEPAQVAKYIHGVGDSDNFLVKLLGGAAGVGLISRIVRGYTFISRNYLPGDRIYLVGFSRGAYTARALGGLISGEGLIDARKIDLASDREVAYRWGSAVWYAHSKKRKSGSALGALQSWALDLPGFFVRPPNPDQMVQVGIKAVGVWDTVGALGIPEYAHSGSERIQSLQFVDTALSSKVEFGFHAISIDELRADFAPTLWDARTGVDQCLFPGAHADVGGGYPTGNRESGLSDGALEWMTSRLAEAGVLFNQQPTYKPAADPAGTAHEPWRPSPWNLLQKSPRVFPPGLKSRLATSVIARKGAGAVRADPDAPPAPYLPRSL